MVKCKRGSRAQQKRKILIPEGGKNKLIRRAYEGSYIRKKYASLLNHLWTILCLLKEENGRESFLLRYSENPKNSFFII